MKTSNLYYIQFIFVCFVSIALLTNCDKTGIDADIEVIIDNTSVGSPIIVEGINAKTYSPHFVEGQEWFDWENLAYLPLPENVSAIPMPWNQTARVNFSEDIRYDMKKADGWELYLSSFSPSLNVAVKSFSLYNKYNGIFRYYYYLQGDPSDFEKMKDCNILFHSISIFGDHAVNCPLLNFSKQDIVDMEKNANSCQTVESQPQPMSDGVWYAIGYELAFDKDIYNQKKQDFLFSIGLSSMDVTFTHGMGFPGTPESMYISGSDDSGGVGFSPFYRNALGVFYLNKKPIVNYAKLAENSYQYSLMTNSVEYLFNPSVLEIVDIKNIQQEIVATNTELREPQTYSGQKLTSNVPLDIQGVRVGFDVVPKDGSQTVHIVKTFKADIK